VFVAVAIAGAAVVGAVASNVAGNRQASAVESGAASAAQATIESTRMQIEEIRRQFDYQQNILLPQIQSQYNAQGAFSSLLGIGGPSPTSAPRISGPQSGAAPGQPSNAAARGNFYEPAAGGGGADWRYGGGERGRRIPGPVTPGMEPDLPGGATIDNETGRVLPQYPDSGATQFQRGPGGEFIDPNLDPTRLADVNTLGDVVRGNLQAGTSAADDPYRNYIDENRMAAGSAGEDIRVRRAGDVRLADGAAGTGVYGENFQESVGYGFQVEEMNRATDRVGSAGGNYGGRAIMEAQRRAQGLANTEYYNWAAGRERDLGRQGSAEAFDIGRGDTALSQYENQRLADVGRGDSAYQDYLRRSEGDAARLDSAAGQEDALMASDQARGDQAYYNYLANLSRVAGFGGGPAADAVNASQAASAATTGAYARQGGQLSGIYGQQGTDLANIEGSRVANITNSLVSGAQNYATYRSSLPPPPPPGGP